MRTLESLAAGLFKGFTGVQRSLVPAAALEVDEINQEDGSQQ